MHKTTKRILLFLVHLALLLSFTACSQGGSEGGSDSSTLVTSDITSEHIDGTFDIEEVQKNIYYKDHRFEIPITLGELKNLDEGWGHTNVKYGEEFYDEDGLGYYEITYNGEVAFGLL